MNGRFIFVHGWRPLVYLRVTVVYLLPGLYSTGKYVVNASDDRLQFKIKYTDWRAGKANYPGRLKHEKNGTRHKGNPSEKGGIHGTNGTGYFNVAHHGNVVRTQRKTERTLRRIGMSDMRDD